jgi:hypothetical protein
MSVKPTTATTTNDLKNRAISAQKSYQCCSAGRKKLEQDLRRVLGELLEKVSNAGSGSGIALLPAFAPLPAGLVTPGGPVVAFPRIIQIGSRLPAGLVLLYSGAFLSDTIRQTAAITATQAAIEAVDQITKPKTKDDECEKCVRKNLWSQARKIVRLTTTKKRRTRNPTRPKRTKKKPENGASENP